MSILSVPVPQTAATRMIPVARPSIGEAEERAVLEVLRSGWITQGPRVAEFESAFSAYLGCRHAVAVSSCTTALQLALLAQGIGPDDEVICPSLSFIATANSIASTGATPVFCDIDLATYNLDPALVEMQITDRTRAILVVHQIGLPAEMNALAQVAGHYGIPIIEDAACAIGSAYEGNLIGRPIGRMACFSFHPRKILTTGEGGMITTDEDELAERLRRLRQHAMSLSDVARHNARTIATETYDEVGYNYRMTDMQAAIGLAQLGRLPDFLQRRRALAARYTEAFTLLPWLECPAVPANCQHNYQSYMLRIVAGSQAERDCIMQDLLEQNISTRRAIMAIHREAPYRSARWENSLPNTDCATETGFILPLFHQMTEEEQDRVIDAIQRTRR
jgi:dTDP-4-amino-4,6-dideoxygalactose transaminase